MNASTKRDSVSRLMKAWESKNAKRALQGVGLSTMAVSLAACGGSAEDSSTGDTDTGVTSIMMVAGTDTIETGADVVVGTIGASSGLAAQQLDLSTYEQGDAVAGDGATQLEIVVNDFGSISGIAVTSYTSPDVTVSGVSSVVLVDENGVDHLEFDMANFDGQVETITLETSTSGSTFDVDVINFVADSDTFTLAMNPMSDTVGNIDVIDAEMVVNASLDHYTQLDANVGAQGDNNGATASSVTLNPEASADIISLVAGAEGVAELFLDAIDTGFANSGPADVGPLTMDITASAAKQGEVELDLDYQATSATNTATVGAFEIVDFDVTLAKDSDGSHVTASQELQEAVDNGNVFNFDISASVSAVTSGTGSATVGDVTVSDIVVTGDLRAELEMISIDADALVASGTGAATVGDMTVGDVTVTLSNGGNIELVEFAANANFTGTSGTATVGDRTVGDVALTVGNAAEGVVFTNNAGASNTATGDATVGSMTVGDVAMTVGDNAVATVAAYRLVNAQAANAAVGAATVGDVTVGDVSATFGSGAAATAAATIDISAGANVSAGTGHNAGVGNVTVGDVTFAAGATHQGDLAITIGASANVTGTGNASAGNITVGDVSMSLGSSASSASMVATIGASVAADIGSATIGNGSIGTITLVSGDGNNLADAINVGFAAAVATTGDAAIGNVTVGMVSLDVGDNTGTDAANLAVRASSAKGNATIGDVTFGGLTYTGDVSADLTYSAAVAATAASTTAAAVTATVGDVAYGSATATLNTSADSVDIRNVLDVNAQTAAVGAVSVGDVTVSVEEAVANTRNVHNVDILDVDVTATASGTLTVGAMTVGDITLSASHSNATVSAASIDADIVVDINFTGTGESIGDITVGDITVTVGDLAHVDVVVDVDGLGASLGAVTIGDVSVTGVNGSNTTLTADAVDFSVILNSAEDVGAVTVGNIVMALADGQNGNVLVSVSAGVTDDSGNITIGNVTASVGDSGFFDMTVNNNAGGTAGDITVGDISLTRTTDSADDAFDVAIAAADGDITIGDITVSGAFYNGAPITAATNIDNGFTGIFALTAAGGAASVTVGDIDYRGFEAYAVTTAGAGTAWTDLNVTIDFSGVDAGVSNVYAAATDTTIIDNADGNNIYLGAGNDTVTLNVSNTGGLANSSGSSATGTAASVSNKIYDIALGDVIDFNLGNGLSLVTTPAASYQAFLTNAEAAITAAMSVYIGKVGTTYYAAVDTNGDGALDVDNNDYIVMLDMTDAEAIAIDAAGGFIA